MLSGSAWKHSSSTHKHSSSSRTRSLASTQTVMAAAPEPLFSVGVISDIQYADIPDGQSFHGVPRFYRNSVVATKRAMLEGWVPASVDFGIHVGDVLDGFQPKDKSQEMLQRVIDAFQLSGRRTYSLLGNHCLYNLPRSTLNAMLDIPTAPDGASYYSFSPHPAWRFVMVDAYDISVLGWDSDHPKHLEANAILDKHNPNEEKNSPDGLVGVQRRFVKFGGGVSQQQLQWLKEQLQEAEQEEQCVIVCCHLPLYPDTCPPACLVWNYEAVLDIFQQFPGVVVATIAGHTHQNGYLVDAAGVHHMVLPGVVEAAPGRDAYGVMEVYPDKLLLKGVDICMSCNCKLPAAAVQRQQRAAARQQQQLAGGGAGAAAGAAAEGGSCDSDIVVDVTDSTAAAAAASKLGDAVGAISLEAVAVAAAQQ